MSVLEFLESRLEIRSEDVAYTETVTADLVNMEPILLFPAAASYAASRSLCVGRIR